MTSKTQHMSFRDQSHKHIRQMIAHETDGPITAFVLIDRAIKLAGEVGARHYITRHYINSQFEDISNALYEELEERGWIDTESLEENGS